MHVVDNVTLYDYMDEPYDEWLLAVTKNNRKKKKKFVKALQHNHFYNIKNIQLVHMHNLCNSTHRTVNTRYTNISCNANTLRIREILYAVSR